MKKLTPSSSCGRTPASSGVGRVKRAICFVPPLACCARPTCLRLFLAYNASVPNYRRARVDGGTYFFTVNTFRRQPFLTDPDVRAALRAGIATVRAEHPFVIEAWVLLPDHMHALWTLPEADHDFPTRWRIIKSTVTQRCRSRLHRPEWMTTRRALRHQSTLWQHRFWEHTIRDETDFVRHVDYIHWNPVKHGYVQRAADWPYSSFHRYVKHGLLPANWAEVEGVANDGDFGE